MLTEILTQLLPTLQSCEQLQLAKGDVLIHAPGFEDRTMGVLDVVESSASSSAILLHYLPADRGNRLDQVRAALLSKGVTTTDEDIVAYDSFEPGDFESRLRQRLRMKGARRVVVDISTMSKLAIMLVLNVCDSLDVGVRVLYSEAEEYGPTKEEFEDAVKNNEIHRPTLQVFTGVYGVVRVSSLASVSMQGQPTAALVFMSFNDALTQILLNTVYPSRLFLINGSPPVHNWREAATAWIHDQVRREWEDDNPVAPSNGDAIPLPQRSVSTLDYKETVCLLLKLYWELSATHRILLAPSGSKLQAVGAYIVRALHRDIHIEYPAPEGFFPRYSNGVATKWLLELGQISPLLSAISTAEREAYLEIPT
jgi:hypothetical protein